MRLFRVGDAVAAGREQADARLGPAAGGGEAVAERGEERRVALDVEPGLQAAERTADRQPVFQRIAGTGGCAQMIGQHAPLASRPTPEIERDEIQVVIAGRFQPDHRPQEMRAAGDERGRDQPLLDQLCLTVEIGDDMFEQVRPLDDAGGDLRPLVALDQQRYRRQRPRPFLGFSGDAEARADILSMVLHAFARTLQIVAANGDDLLQHRRPRRAVGRVAQHVAGAALGAIVRDPAPRVDGRIEQARRGQRRHVRSAPFAVRRCHQRMIAPPVASHKAAARATALHRSGST